jgi:hypothetical protein
MTIFDQPQQSPTIEEVREQFENWRRSRKKRTAIPEHLWAAAVSLTQRHSVHEISRNLRLNYAGLRKRTQSSPSERLPETVRPSFIGLEIGQSEYAEYVIEMSQCNGAALKAHIKGPVIDFLELSKSFFGSAK